MFKILKMKAIKTRSKKKKKSGNWKKYGFEFLSIFIAVITAFALNNWNEKRRDSNSENKILIEIDNGLDKDIEDIKINIGGHKQGILACNYFTRAFNGIEVDSDSIVLHYFNLTRDYISIQNTAGYETLKSKGLELVQNDSLRLKIISIYEYDYNALQKFEEEYFEMQFQKNYFKEINEELAPYIEFDATGEIIGLISPLEIPKYKKQKLLLYLWKIKRNRNYILRYYSEIETKIFSVRKSINNEIKD